MSQCHFKITEAHSKVIRGSLALASLYSLPEHTGCSLPVSRFATGLVYICKYLLPSDGRRDQAEIVQITASIFISQLMITPTWHILHYLTKIYEVFTYFSVCAIHASVPAIKRLMAKMTDDIKWGLLFSEI